MVSNIVYLNGNLKKYELRKEREMAGELFKIFSEFPTNKHIMEICNPEKGEKTCRYLITGSYWECLKMNNSEKIVIDKKVKNNKMVAKGDNCIGLPVLIIKEQKGLSGRKASYTGIYSFIESKVKEIEIKENFLIVTINWKNKRGVEEGREFDFEINKLNIVLNSKFVIFSQKLDLGKNSIKKFTIFF